MLKGVFEGVLIDMRGCVDSVRGCIDSCERVCR